MRTNYKRSPFPRPPSAALWASLALAALASVGSVLLVVLNMASTDDPLEVAPVAVIESERSDGNPAGMTGRSTLTLDNASGEIALVKTVGPTVHQVTVPNGERRTVNLAPGRYFLKVRYGATEPYRYTKGEAFTIEESATHYVTASITLHPVANGNYQTWPLAPAQF